ncbi:MAG: phytoene desaturase family protein [bacterium]
MNINSENTENKTMPQSPKVYDFTIIGAGVAGLAVAALLAKDGFKVKLIESHSKPGGCASFFRNAGFRYDVGATTLSGLEEGQPIAELIQELGLDKVVYRNKIGTEDKETSLRLSHSERGTQIFQDGKIIHRYTDKEKWIDESYEKLISNKNIDTEKNHQAFWNELYRIEKSAFKILKTHKNLLPNSFQDYLSCLAPSKLLASLSGLTHLPQLYLPLKYLLKKYFLSDEKDFIKFLDEQLIISTQNNTEKTPIFTAALGLTYSSSVYYVYGGVNQLAVALQKRAEELGVEIIMRREVTEINPSPNQSLLLISKDDDSKQNEKYEQKKQPSKIYLIKDKTGEEHLSKGIISNLTFWSMAKLTEGETQNFFQGFVNKFNYDISAFTIYLGLNTNYVPPTDYAQINLNKPIQHCCSNSFYISYSRPDDHIKASEGGLNIIISTHTQAQEWLNLSEEEYLKKKAETESYILEELFNTIPELVKEGGNAESGTLQRSTELAKNESKISLDEVRHKIKSLISGTAKTFLHYTKRKNGVVGGLPHSTDYSFFELMPKKVPNENIYMVGDTGFPGQGLVSTVYSALSVRESLRNKNPLMP